MDICAKTIGKNIKIKQLVKLLINTPSKGKVDKLKNNTALKREANQTE